MKLIQISDLHIPDLYEESHGIDVKQNLETMISKILLLDFDALVITGDLAFRQANSSSYNFIKNELKQISKPIYIIAGNHDSFDVLQHFFLFPEKKSYYSRVFENHTFLFLDSSNSYIDSAQIEWIKQSIVDLDRVNIFIHHPILQTDVVFMESKHTLQNRDKIQNILLEFAKPVSIFCGHFHIERQNENRNITQYITPSIFYQINPTVLRFTIGSLSIGYRIIEVENSIINTHIVWI